MNESRKYCAFLRSMRINGRALRMPDICDVFRQAGMTEVKQVIAAGIVSFGSALDQDILRSALSKAMKKHYGHSVDMVVKE